MNTITKKSFKSLTKTEQVVMVIKSGKELLTRQDKDNFVKLYLLSNIFVELLYEINKSTIVKIGTPSTDQLMNDYNINKENVNELLHS